MASNVPVSILDLAFNREGQTPSFSLAATTESAVLADQLGYHRFWVGEHHSVPIAATDPTVLSTHIAAHTEQIRVGPGALILPNHAPLMAAERVGMLRNLFPGRIDLGMGRAPATKARTAAALRRTPGRRGLADYPRHVRDVLSLLHGLEEQGTLADYYDANVTDEISGNTIAPVNSPFWMLGTSTDSAKVAAEIGLPFCFGTNFFTPFLGSALESYRKSFVPSILLSRPYVMASVAILIADSKEEAEYLSTSSKMCALGFASGSPRPLLPPNVAQSRLDKESFDAAPSWPAIQLAGPAQFVAERLNHLVEQHRLDELMITTVVYDPASAMHTLAEFARVWGLTPLSQRG